MCVCGGATGGKVQGAGNIVFGADGVGVTLSCQRDILKTNYQILAWIHHCMGRGRLP